MFLDDFLKLVGTALYEAENDNFKTSDYAIGKIRVGYDLYLKNREEWKKKQEAENAQKTSPSF